MYNNHHDKNFTLSYQLKLFQLVSLQFTGSSIMITSGALVFEVDSVNDEKFYLSSIYG